MPPKRQRSSSPLPTAKRHREALGDYVRPLNVPAPEGFPAIEEIVHHIFSYLSAVDLCAIQGVSKFWNRLASDNQLWKALYIHEHPRHRLPNTKTSFSNARNPQRQIRSLPQRAVEYEQKDYKWLYRIAKNWERGRCAHTSIRPSFADPFFHQLGGSSSSGTTTGGELHPPPHPAPTPNSPQCAVLAAPYVVLGLESIVLVYSTTSPHVASSSPSSGASRSSSQGHSLLISIPSTDSSPITTIAIDQSKPSSSSSSSQASSGSEGGREGTIRLSVHHSSGHFDIFLLAPCTPSTPNLDSVSEYASPRLTSTLLYTQPAPRASSQLPVLGGAPLPRPPAPSTTLQREQMADIVCAAYHHPVLVTLSKAFHVLVYYLPPLGGNSSSGTLAGASTTASRGLSGPGATKPILARSIHSYSSYAPASMILTRAPAPTSKPTFAPAAAGTTEENADAQTTADANSSANMAFKLVLAYTVPVYPAHWTAGAAELGINISTIPASLSGKPPIPDVRITSSRTCSAITSGWGETPFGISSGPLAGAGSQNEDDKDDEGEEDEDEEDPWRTVAPVPSIPVSSLLPFPTSFASTSSAAPVPTTANLSTPAGMTSLAREELVRRRYERAVEQYSRKIGHVVGIQTDGKWIVVAGGNNVLQVYRLHRPSASPSKLPSESNSRSPVPLRLTFSRSLYGHTAGIAALRVADGRCISLGREGRVWVWDLEGTGKGESPKDGGDGVHLDWRPSPPPPSSPNAAASHSDTDSHADTNDVDMRGASDPRRSERDAWRAAVLPSPFGIGIGIGIARPENDPSRYSTAGTAALHEPTLAHAPAPPLVLFDEHRIITSLGTSVDDWLRSSNMGASGEMSIWSFDI